MDSTTPTIDQRNQTELAGQLRELLVHYCPDTWNGAGQIAADKWTDSLVQIYGRLLEVIIQHLNRMPDKNFLAFLDTLGIGLLPPRPAKAPLVFTLAKGAPPYATVPAGTQVAAAVSPDKKPVIFETDRDLTVIQPRLIRAVSFVPAEDTWRDHSGMFFSEEATGRETLFDGNELVRHRLYLGDNGLFSFAENKNVTLEVIIAPPMATESGVFPEKVTIGKPLGGNVITKVVMPTRTGTADLSATGGTGSQQLRWYTFAEDSAEPVPLAIDPKTPAGVVNLMASGTIQFSNVAPIPEKEISGFAGQDGKTFKRSSRWLFAELTVPVTEINAPQLTAIKVKVTDTAPVSYQPESAFFGNFPLDLSKDFFPFGERPRVSDVLYLASAEIFGNAGAAVTITVNLSAGLPVPDTSAITLQWEYWDGARWQTLTVADTTGSFITPGTIVFTCPDMPLRELNGLESRWLRVRIADGGYGQGAGTVECTKKMGWKVEWRDNAKMMYAKTGNDYAWVALNDETVWDYSPATYKPPSLQSLTLSFIPVFKQPADIVLDNNFFCRPIATGKTLQPFPPFQGSGEAASAFYLAFDRTVAGLPATLFFPMITEVFAAPAIDTIEPPRLNWEYWNGSQWLSLAVEDDTMELTRRGMLSLLFPQDSVSSSCFADQRHWFRARLTQGSYASKPQLAAVYSNAVWARNRVTVSDELLGSGNGKPAQGLQFANTPVLPGQELLVREAELTDEERQAIEQEEGGDALRDVDGQGSRSEKWVRWHEVGHFWFSGPHSRHYCLDRKTGTVTFGDGKKGMIPQAGRNNIQASPYQYGGGSRGNVAKGVLTKLRKAIPYVGTVTNPVAAEGGADVENLNQVRVRGPRSIRHRNKAVTLTDYEWLVSEASPKIARVKGLSVTNPQQQFKPGWVTMMVVPHSTDVKPLPSAELISEVTGYLAGKAPSCLTELVELQQINLIPPNYLRVDVTASVAVRSIGDAKEVENLVLAVLRNFLHPLTGGPEGRGWEFGRHVYKTEIHEALEKIDKVDHVSEVSINAAEQIYEIEVAGSLHTATVFPDHSKVQFSGGRISMALAQGLPKNEAIAKLLVLGFMEGDRIELRYVDKAGKPHTLRLYIQEVRNVEDDGKATNRCVLSCLSVKTQIRFPAKETVVEAYLKPQSLRIRSFLTAATDDKEISTLEIAVPTPGEAFVISHRDWRSNTLPGSVQAINMAVETVFLERDYLVYSGHHAVAVNASGATDTGSGSGQTTGSEPEPPQKEIVPAYVYLANTNTREIHYLPAIKKNCGLALMTPEHKKYLMSLQEIAGELHRGTYDYCGWCFSKKLSLR